MQYEIEAVKMRGDSYKPLSFHVITGPWAGDMFPDLGQSGRGRLRALVSFKKEMFPMKKYVLVFLLLVPFAGWADGYGFRTPSGNIYCNGAVLDGFMDCTIVERGGVSPLPRPGDCSGNWGHDFHLDATGPARMSCSNFALRKSRYSDVAGYGQSAQFGPIACQSERTGLTCRNQSGHGFFLSRRRQEMF